MPSPAERMIANTKNWYEEHRKASISLKVELDKPAGPPFSLPAFAVHQYGHWAQEVMPEAMPECAQDRPYAYLDQTTTERRFAVALHAVVTAQAKEILRDHKEVKDVLSKASANYIGRRAERERWTGRDWEQKIFHMAMDREKHLGKLSHFMQCREDLQRLIAETGISPDEVEVIWQGVGRCDAQRHATQEGAKAPVKALTVVMEKYDLSVGVRCLPVGQTLLHEAIEHGCMQATKYLIKRLTSAPHGDELTD